MDPFFSQHFQHNPQLMFYPLYPEETQPLNTVQYLTNQSQSLFIQPTYTPTIFTPSQHPNQNIYPYTYHNTFPAPQLLANNPYNANTQQSYQPIYYGIPQYQEQASSSQPQTSQSLESRVIDFMIEVRSSLQQLEFQFMQLSDKIKEQGERNFGTSAVMAITEQRGTIEIQRDLPQVVQEAVAEASADPAETDLLCKEDFHAIDAEALPTVKTTNVVAAAEEEPPLSPSMQIAIQVLMSGFPPPNTHSPAFILPSPPNPYEITIPPIVYHRKRGRKNNPEQPPKIPQPKKRAPRTAATKRAPRGKKKIPQ